MAGVLVFSVLKGARAFDAGCVYQEHRTTCHTRITDNDHLLYRGTEGLVGDARQLHVHVDHCHEGTGLDWTNGSMGLKR